MCEHKCLLSLRKAHAEPQVGRTIELSAKQQPLPIAILVSGPKFDSGANIFLLFSQGEKALFTELGPAKIFLFLFFGSC